MLLGTLSSPSNGFSLMTYFSGNRSMEFHQSGWFFKCQTDGIPLIWSLKFQNSLHLSPLWVWIGLNCIFRLWDTSAMDFKKKKWKNNYQKIIFPYLEIDPFYRIAHIRWTSTNMSGFFFTVLSIFFYWILISANFSLSQIRGKPQKFTILIPRGVGGPF